MLHLVCECVHAYTHTPACVFKEFGSMGRFRHSKFNDNVIICRQIP